MLIMRYCVLRSVRLYSRLMLERCRCLWSMSFCRWPKRSLWAHDYLLRCVLLVCPNIERIMTSLAPERTSGHTTRLPLPLMLPSYNPSTHIHIKLLHSESSLCSGVRLGDEPPRRKGPQHLHRALTTHSIS